MIYLKITGNAGNQLFQYAFARKIMELRKDKLFIDFSYAEIGDGVHKAENVLQQYHVVDYIDSRDGHYFPFQKIIYLLLIRILPLELVDAQVKGIVFKNAPLFEKIGLYFYDGEDYLNYNYTNCFTKNVFIRGYWECTKYFDDIRDILIEELTPIKSSPKENDSLYSKMSEGDSICVTTRRYDPEKEKGNVSCSIEYFQAGVKFIREKYKDAPVFVFSDDIQWCKDNLDFGENTFYETGNDPIYEKLRLMSSCKHFVISNSTFSWWAQYLSKNERKIVVAPEQWRPDPVTPIDIYDDSWVLFDNSGRLVKNGDLNEKE